MNYHNLAIGLGYPLEAADRTRLEQALAKLLPQGRHEVLRLREDEPLPAHARIYLAVDTPPAGLDQHPNLMWIQACSAGADAFLSLPNVRNGSVRLTSASGIHSVSIAEFVIAAMINLARRTDRLWSLMQAREWPSPRAHLAGPVLRGQTVAILGYGSIGREIGRLAHALGMKIVAITRQADAHPDLGFQIAPDVGDRQGVLPAQWFSSDKLAEAVVGADFLVIACPLTERTRGIVNRSVLDAMKSTACLVNVARGAVVDFAALRASLETGRLAGAALDVFAVEPLPAHDPVYDLPNVQLTPHMSGVMSDAEYSRLLADVFLENLARFARHEELLNLVKP